MRLPHARGRLKRAAARRYTERVTDGDQALEYFVETVAVMRHERPGATLAEVIDATRTTIRKEALLLLESELRAAIPDEQQLQAAILRVQQKCVEPQERGGET